MKNSIKFLLFILLLFLPLNTFAISNDYKDVVYDVTGYDIDDDKVTLYLFHGAECPHCNAEIKWLDTIKDKYKEVDFVYYEVWHNKENSDYLDMIFNKLHVKSNSIPFTVIGDEYFVGFSDSVKEEIENCLKDYLEINENENTNMNIPILNKIDPKNVSIGLVAIILGFVDGFNPCAMWILLFLINMLLHLEDKKKRIILGVLFLLTSGVVYFLSMLGISFILDFHTITWIRYLIALVAVFLGIFNLFKFNQSRKIKDIGCQVVDDKKRKKIINKLKTISQEKSFLLASIGIITLAVSVNLIEMACSLGFPLIFTEILTINEIKGILKIGYLLIYILFYMLDDILIFVIAMKTLEATGFTNKYSKYTKLIGGILMILIGLLMIFKYEWLTLNF